VSLEHKEGKASTYKKVLFNAALIVAVVIVWEIASWLVKSSFFPSFSDFAAAFVKVATIGDVQGYTLLEHAGASVLRVLAGFVVAIAVGFPLGLVMGLKPLIYDSSRSVLEPIRFIPPIAWIPLAIILLTGYSRYIFIIWLGALFPILLNTIAAVKRTSPVFVDVAKTFGAKKTATVSKVVVPSALPEVAAGMRIGLGVGWMTIIAAEIISGESVGLGRLIWNYTELLSVDYVLVGMITIGLIGLVMNEMFLQAEKRVFKWRQEIRV
jgi:NitT/TauT family transport system permease protein